ncbi:MAG: FtsX-like permease family protein, partial [Bacteroidota bacterium]
LLAAFVLAFLALPYLRGLTGSSYTFGWIEVLQALGAVSAVGTVIGLLAGGYPAFFISNFQPLSALKSSLSTGSKGSRFRRVLVIVQFAISSILILSTALVFQQLEYIKGKNLGYDKNHMLIFYITGDSETKEEAFKESLLNHSSIISYGMSSHIPSTQLTAMTSVQAEVGNEMVKPEAFVKNVHIDEDFLPNYGIELLAGRNFDRLLSSDSATFIMNEAAVKLMGWASNEEAIGKQMDYNGLSGRVIGVTEDVHFETLHSAITPLIYLLAEGPLRSLSLKMQGENLPKTLQWIEEEWNVFFPEEPAQYYFLDERFNELYAAEQQRSELVTLLSLIAILIACLGLFGLASFTVTQRTREVGIRKALGASIRHILILLSKEFIVLVGGSLIIGFPIAFHFTQQWLGNYAYRIDIGPRPFIMTALISLLMAFVAVSLRTFKVATDNPVKSLRYE